MSDEINNPRDFPPGRLPTGLIWESVERDFSRLQEAISEEEKIEYDSPDGITEEEGDAQAALFVNAPLSGNGSAPLPLELSDSSIAPGGVLTLDPGSQLTVDAKGLVQAFTPGSAADLVVKEIHASVSFSDFVAENGPVEIGVLPAGAMIFFTKLKHSTAFAPAGGSYIYADFGVIGDEDRYINNHDVSLAPSATFFGTGGVAFNFSHTTTEQLAVNVEFDPVSGLDYSDLTAGVLEVWLYYVIAT
jgi:hypothetical protein